MFEREIKFIYDFNLNKVNKLGPFFTFEQLLTSDLHPAILQYISAEIDYLIFEDRQKLLKNSVFDYSGEKISYYFNQISEEAKKTKRFALEYIAKLILHASSFTVNYLVHPKWTLQKFVFDEDTHKTTNEIKQILNYVYYYKYLNKILISYINTKKILSMNVQEFEELLNKADKLGVETYLSAILSNALKSMAEFLNIGEIKKNKIPLSAVEMFLEEKELTAHLQKVNEVFGNDENAKFTITDYEKVLSNVMIVKEEVIPDAVEEEKFEEQEIEAEEQLTDESEEEIETLTEVKEERREDYDQEQDQEQEEQLVEEKSGDDKEITITHATKLRIRVDEDNRIETINESETKKYDEQTVEEGEKKFADELSEVETDSLVEKENEQGISKEEMINDKIEDENEEAEHLSFLFKQKEDEDIKTNESGDSGKENITHEEKVSSDVVKEQIKNEISEEGVNKIDNDKQPLLDLAEILGHKEMTKIIEVIYDYDIEDFAKTLDEISNCKDAEDAYQVINQALIARRINRNSKEAETFREIIAEYFGNR